MTAPLTAAKPAAEQADRSKAILVADDDPTMRLLVTQALGEDFGPVVEAENGRIAVDRLEDRAYRLAVVDLDMPVLDGFGVISNARAAPETRYLPIIVVTSRDDVIAIERAFALGATSFICKPLNWNIFRHQVRYVLEMARIADETRQMHERSEFQLALRRAGMKAIQGAVAHAADDPEFKADDIRSLADRVARMRNACDLISGDTILNRAHESAADLLASAVAKAEEATGESGRVAIQGEDRTLDCDRRLMIEALAEILRNALTYSTGPVDASIVTAGEGSVRFEIADKGSGIPDAALEQALDPSCGGPRGQSLGLAIAAGIVRMHGGHFGVLSEPAGGTEVFLTV